MSLWQDGTSNQIIFGEKHIPAWALELDPQGNTTYPWSWDIGYMTAMWDAYVTGFARVALDWPGVTPIARSPNDPGVPVDAGVTSDRILHSSYQFGSNHPGVVNFVLGDGSVRGVSVSILPKPLADLANVSDGNTASLQ
jgi:hypothetical protein